MTTLPRVSVLGCGWLGFPLAQVLVRQGYQAKGSTTHLEKVPVLKKAGIFSFCFAVGKTIEGDFTEFFDSEIVVVTLPFRRAFVDPKEYQDRIFLVIEACVKASVPQWIIFTSSTSVYPENLLVAKEDAELIPDNPRSRILYECEQMLLNDKRFASTIVRLAGLYGGHRKIGNFLSGEKKLTGGLRPVNLLHRDDAVGILLAIIQQNAKGKIFNACSDEHPLRKDLYTLAAKKLGITPPEFETEEPGQHKIISNDQVKRELKYRFVHSDPMKDVEAGI